MHEIETSLLDADAIGFGVFHSHNQKVVSNRHGIFATHVYASNEDYSSQAWRLSGSTDGGRSWRTVYEARHATNPPVLETDEDGNLLLFFVEWDAGHGWFARMEPDNDFRTPRLTRIPDAAAGKFCMVRDRDGGVLYYVDHIHATLIVLDPDGQERRRRHLLLKGPDARIMYPQLAVAEDGELFFAWTTQRHGRYLYWDIHVMRSRDGGQSWHTLAGAPLDVPVCADQHGPTDRVTHDDEFDVHSWLSALCVRDGKLHMVYHAQHEPLRQHYVLYDLATGAREADVEPFLGTYFNARQPAASGLFAWNRSARRGRLYFVGGIDGKRVACVVSGDNGRSWQPHAIMPQPLDGSLYCVGGARQITADGYIIGTFAEQAAGRDTNYQPGSGRIWFYRIEARG